mmetsp:Transcript_10189/g.13623  ORF Transcript_10189/g.13623 Transcript_10189/m.13623 type:complete len:87 (+) Transcript_10189:100-360(+)
MLRLACKYKTQAFTTGTGKIRVGCASVLNTCLFKISTSVSGSNNRYRYFSVSAKKKLSILSSTEPGSSTFVKLAYAISVLQYFSID